MTGPLALPVTRKPTFDVTNCEREPIHTPGAVQAHALFLAIDPRNGLPCAASENLAAVVGLDARTLLSARGLGIFDAETRRRLLDMARGARPLEPFRATLPDGETWAGHPYRSEGALLLDLEPEGRDEALQATVLAANAAMRSLREAPDEAALFQGMADAMARITGYDRAMVYRFDAELCGEVVAETRNDSAPGSFLGLKFPSSDIPAQARALFERNRVRHIPDVTNITHAITPDRNPLTGGPFDLSDSWVRAVSPVHIEYLTNMGVRASLSIALIVNARLWGLVACHHHNAAKLLAPRVRAACTLLSEAFSARLAAHLNAVHRVRLEQTAGRLDSLRPDALRLAQEGRGAGYESFVRRHARTLLWETHADALWLRMEGVEVALGDMPPPARVAAIVQAADDWTRRSEEEVVAVDDLRQIGLEPEVGSAGFVWQRMPGGEGSVLAIRRERIREDSWAGDPDKRVMPGNSVERLHPRRSFELWRAETRGRSLPWSSTDIKSIGILCNRLFAFRWVFLQAEREALIERLRRSDEESRQLALVAERANDAVMVSGPDGRIRWVNAAFTQMTGYSFNEARGRSPGELLQGKDTDRAEAARIGAAIAAREPVRATLVNYAKNGRPYWVELDMAPVFNAEGAVEQFVAIERDVTVARQREADLAAALDAAQTADRLKAEFLRSISHEVRTPLNGVLGITAILGHKLGDDYAALLGQIEDSGRALLDMFTTMLDLALAETGTLAVNTESLEVDDILADATATVSAMARQKGIALNLRVAAEGARVLGDRERAVQVLVSLLRNAIQFTPRGTVSVAATWDRPADPVRITVSDQGPGVPEADRDALFARFRQADGAETRGHGGLGASLSLARDLVELMGGRIGVGDAAGGGAAFWFELARDPASLASPEPIRPGRKSAEAAPQRTLKPAL